MAYISSITTLDGSSYDIKAKCLAPMISKTFTTQDSSGTTIYGSANDAAGASFYFGKVRPKTFNEPWELTYRINVFVANNTNYNQSSTVTMAGCGSGRNAYSITNSIYSTSYRAAYYHNLYSITSTGYNNGYGNLIGVGLRSSTNSTSSSYPRTIVVEIFDVKGGTFEFFDYALKYANVSGTGSTNYSGLSEWGFATNGHFPNDNTYNRLLASYFRPYAGTSENNNVPVFATAKAYAVKDLVKYNETIYRCITAVTASANTSWSAVSASFAVLGLPPYALFAMDASNRAIPLAISPDNTGATKLLQQKPFRPRKIYFSYSSSYYAGGAATGDGVNYEAFPMTQVRYTFNADIPTYRSAFIKGQLGEDGLFTQDTSSATSNLVTLPTNTASLTLSDYFVEGCYYIYLGSTSSTKNYMQLETNNTLYYFDGTYLVEAAYRGDSENAVSDVKIGNNSIVSDGVATIPISSTTETGVGMVSTNRGTTIVNDTFAIYSSRNSDIDARTSGYRPIVPNNLDYAVKASLTDDKSLVTYTDAEKLAAATRLGAVPETRKINGQTLDTDVIIESLKNPYPLTVNGNAYDGSTAMSVDTLANPLPSTIYGTEVPQATNQGELFFKKIATLVTDVHIEDDTLYITTI